MALWFGLNSVIWLVFWLLVSWLLAGIFLSDLTYQTIPDDLSLGLMGFGLVRVFWQRDWSGLLAGLGVGLFFWLLHVGTKKKGMGLGDVRLVPGLGFLLGATKTLVGMYVSFLTGAIFGLGLIIFGQKRFGQKIAFGPFLILGTVAAFFWSETLIDWWFGLFGW